MQRVLIAIAVAGAVFAGGVANAQSGAEVVKAKCAGCHDVDKKKVGPAMKDIAAKHKDNKDAAAQLVSNIKEGKGHMKVPATDAELTAGVQHILATK